MPVGFAEISAAAEVLRKGGVVAFPTETVYGLGADAFNEAAIGRVYALKGRPAHNPLIVHVSGPEMARRVSASWPDRAGVLARRFWPGPLSILVPRGGTLPALVTSGSELVAVRCPNHPAALALLFELNSPLVGPSANLSGRVSPTTAEHVRASFGEQELAILDGGPCEGGIESTVVDISGERVRVLRPGPIGADDLAGALGELVLGPPAHAEGQPTDQPLHSPGLLDRHYAPRTPAHVFDERDWPRVVERFGSATIITHRARAADPAHGVIAMPPDDHAYGAALYAALREADGRGAAVILVERPPVGTPIWDAIADRLARATTALPDHPA